jgi:PKD repeat protein
MKRLFTFVAVAASLGCTLGKQNAPGLTGPSEFGLSLATSATPDLMNQDGQSRSTITVVARDANSQPVSGLTLRAEIVVGGFYVDFGALSSRTVSTGSDGRASVTYTAPPEVKGAGSVLVAVVLTPVGTNYVNSHSSDVYIRLTPPGMVLPPNGTPTAVFTFSPTTPRAGDDIQFDASASSDDVEIVSYSWDFGDGSFGSGERETHSYSLAGTYRVTLTVTDNNGLRASTAPINVTVGTSANPVASFSFSPSPQVSGRDVHFNGGLSTAPDGRTIVRYQWDFGDAAGPERFAEGVTASHIFGAAGSYSVVLTVTDDTGRKGTTSQTVNIIPPTEHP